METTKIIFKESNEKGFLGELEFKDSELIEKCVSEMRDEKLGIMKRKPPVMVFGKIGSQPRSVGLVATNTSLEYNYSNSHTEAKQIPENMQKFLNQTNAIFGTEFNSILINEYLDGNDEIGKHSDKEKEVDPTQGVIAFSIGEPRKFRVRDILSNKILIDYNTKHMHYMQMGGKFQKNYTHEIPKQAKIKKSRISFTFRKLLASSSAAGRIIK
jgi:alkylated DNA repair dioxygenase AlkB